MLGHVDDALECRLAEPSLDVIATSRASRQWGALALGVGSERLHEQPVAPAGVLGMRIRPDGVGVGVPVPEEDGTRPRSGGDLTRLEPRRVDLDRGRWRLPER